MQKSISEHITPEADGQQQQINISHNIQDLSVGGAGWFLGTSVTSSLPSNGLHSYHMSWMQSTNLQ